MRESLLAHDPDIRPVTIQALVAIADRVERESVLRYATLEQLMARRGEAATAAAFRFLLNEERAHVDAVQHWAEGLGEPIPEKWQFTWDLPDDLATSWDGVATSATLTPYRAFAIAVDNEQRAFTFYSYLAAHAADPQVARHAERLAIEELRHAALMRRWRRQAWHRERRVDDPAPPTAETAGDLHELLARHETTIAARHRAIAARLRSLGDEESARLLEHGCENPSWPAASGAASDASPVLDDDPVRLLVAAQEPLEVLSEVLEGVMRTLEGDLFAEAEAALGNVVRRLGRIALRTASCMQPA